MNNKFQGWLTPNTLTEDPNDRILVLNSAGTVDNEQLYKDTGVMSGNSRSHSKLLRMYRGTSFDERAQC